VIIVLELPAGAPRAWFAFDAADLLRKVAADDPLPLWQIHDRISARELLAVVDATPDGIGAAQRQPAIFSLAAEHGWDAPLYRADYLFGIGDYRDRPVSELDAASAALAARGPCRVWADEAQASAAFERTGDPAWQGAGWRARMALREQLIALEVLADDL